MTPVMTTPRQFGLNASAYVALRDNGALWPVTVSDRPTHAVRRRVPAFCEAAIQLDNLNG
jgi:hypothetical protein